MYPKTKMAAAAVAGLATLAAGAQAQNPKNDGISLKAQPTALTWGQAVTLSGKVNGQQGVMVDVQRDPYPFGDGFTTQRTVTSAKNGDYKTSVLPTSHTAYRAVSRTSPELTSEVVVVRVRWNVGLRTSTSTPRRGSLVRFSGSVRPRTPAGRKAIVQRRTSTGGWTTVARATLRADGSRTIYSARIRARVTSVYRVKVSADAAHDTGYSRERTLTVR